MTAKDRLQSIKKIVELEKKVLVSELSKKFEVTEETIRRDLEKLEKKGIVTRIFGGAMLNVANQYEGIHYYKRATIHLEEKRKMAKIFKDILNQKRTILADSSTTVMEVMKLLDDSIQRCIVTNSAVALQELANKDLIINSTGGTFNKNTLSLQGKITKDTIKRFNVDILLISCKGICMEKGIMDSNEVEAEVKQEMGKQAQEIALFVDHTKFNKTALVHMYDWDEIDYLITDEKPDEKWIEFCNEHKIKLMY